MCQYDSALILALEEGFSLACSLGLDGGDGDVLAFMVDTMATASVLATMLPNRAQYCQVHPSLLRSSTYSMMGMSRPQLPPTTRNASVRIFTHACN